MIVRGGGDLVIDFVDQFRMPFDAMDRLGDVDGFAIIDRFAAVDAFHHGQFTGIAGHQFAQTDQRIFAFAGVQTRPTPIIECLSGLGHGEIDVGPITGGDLGDHLPRRRVDRVKGVARYRRAIRAINIGRGWQIQGLRNRAVFLFG